MKNYPKKLFQLSLICLFGFNSGRQPRNLFQRELELLEIENSEREIQFFSLDGKKEGALGGKIKQKDQEEDEEFIDYDDLDNKPIKLNYYTVFKLKKDEIYPLFIDGKLVKVIGTDDQHVKNTVYLYSITQDQELELLRTLVIAQHLSELTATPISYRGERGEREKPGWRLLKDSRFKKMIAWNEQIPFRGSEDAFYEYAHINTGQLLSAPLLRYLFNREGKKVDVCDEHDPSGGCCNPSKYVKIYGDWLEAIMRIVFTGIDGTDNRTDEEAKDILNRLYDRLNNLELIEHLMSNRRHPELAFDVILQNRTTNPAETPEDTTRINAELLARSVRFERLLSEVLESKKGKSIGI